MADLDKEKQKLISRIKRIRGQVDSIERSLTTGDDCADVLMLLANVRGGINSLMAEVLEDHIRLHLLSSEKTSGPAGRTGRRLDRFSQGISEVRHFGSYVSPTRKLSRPQSSYDQTVS